MIAGVPKAGTTSLAAWLGEHPDGWLAPGKELEFFDRHADRGLDWYRQQFAAAPADAIAGEATPAYLQDPAAVERMARLLPDARFVVLLREPVDRAWSNYWFFRQMGVETRSWDRVAADEGIDPLHGPDGLRWGYLGAGRYGPLLRHLLDRAGPERVQIHLFDDLRTDAAAVLAATCRHIGLDPSRQPPPARSRNPTLVPRSALVQQVLHRTKGQRWPFRLGYRVARANLRREPYPTLPPAVVRSFQRQFAESNREVEALIGRRLPTSWWDPGP